MRNKHPYYCNPTIYLHPNFEVIDTTNPPTISKSRDPDNPVIMYNLDSFLQSDKTQTWPLVL
jgi:hypothetical protein